jgi:uncharacterized RDD family membrane protein YckC
MPKLILRLGEELKEFPVTGPLAIGRHPESDIQIAHEKTASRNHARVIPEADGCWIEDLASANGTKVNGERIARRLLRHGDAIQIGGTRITFEEDALGAQGQDEGMAATLVGGGVGLRQPAPAAAPAPMPAQPALYSPPPTEHPAVAPVVPEYAVPPPAQGSPVPVQLDLGAPAGFWVRVVAAIIDGLIVVVPLMILNFILTRIPVIGRVLGFLMPFAALAVNWLYSAKLESSAMQATFGKKIMEIVVVDSTGGRLSFGKATMRWVGKLVSGLILGIGYLMVAFSARKRGLHDILANTLVVKGKAQDVSLSSLFQGPLIPAAAQWASPPQAPTAALPVQPPPPQAATPPAPAVSPAATACQSCGAALPPAARFCRKCGTPAG